MSDGVRQDGATLARRLVAERFPQARAAWLGGSVAAGTSTSASDLDITVLLDGSPAPFRSSKTVAHWPVEWFVQTEDSLLQFCDDARIRRRPTTMRLVGSAIILADRDGSGRRLQQLLRDMERQGPPAASDQELENQRYAVTDLLADLDAARSADECLTLAAALLYAAGELLLLTHRCWSGGGKWLLREIEVLDRDQDTAYGTELLRGVRAAAGNDPQPMRRTVSAVLDQAGGPLFSGFHRSAPAG